jgi:hypothetical protein
MVRGVSWKLAFLLLCLAQALFAATASAQFAFLKYQEKYAENVVLQNDENGTTCVRAQSGKMKLFGMVRSTEDPANYTPDTQVTITFGDYVFTGQLKDDPNYQAGDTQARITRLGLQPIGKRAPVKDVVVLNWGKGQLSASVKANIAEAGDAYGEQAANSGTGPVTVHFDLELSNVGVPFTHIFFPADGSATVSTKSVVSPCGGNIDVRKVKLKAARNG